MRAVAFDLDGTLLNADHKLSAENCDTVERLKASGITVFLASGRTHLSMRPYHQQLNLETPMICYNGAKIVYPDGEVQERGLSAEIVRALIDRSRDERLHLNLYSRGLWYTENPESPEALIYAQTAGLTPHSEGFEELVELGATKALFIASSKRLRALRASLEVELSPHVSITSSMSNFLEVLRRGVNKADALRQVLERYSFSLDEVVAFGDGLNDLELLTEVGHGVAMENAHPKLIEAADAVAPRHHPDGVTRYFRSYAPRLFEG